MNLHIARETIREEAPVDRSFPPISERADHLLSRDFLYEHPESYRAGVLAAIQVLAGRDGVSEQDAASAARRARA